ncbi:MAG: hypothetical protein ABI534_05425 [Chloroflexota bacterium]
MPPPRWLRAALLLLGLLFGLGAAAGIGVGLFGAAWLRSQLPAVTADASVVGGAAVAFGAGLAILGLAHVAVALWLERPSRPVRAIAVVGALVLAMVSVVGLATVGVTLAREASATPLWAAVPLLAAAFSIYAALAVSLLRVERR